MTTQTRSCRRVPELVPQRLPVGELRRVEAGHVAGEVEVLLGPVADRREVGAEAVRNDVVGVADEQRPVAHAPVPSDVLDHLGVVVGCQVGLVRAAILHRQPADEVCEPHVCRSLLLGVLVQVVVELPRLIADPEVVLLRLDEVVEDHEVREQDLVHPPPGLEAVEVVLGRLRLDVARLVGQMLAGRMDPLTLALEHPGDRVLRQPIDFEIGMEPAQLFGDRHVALGVAEPDRRADVQGAPAAAATAAPPGAVARSHPLADRLRALGEIAQQQVDLHGVASLGNVARALEAHEGAAGQLGERGAGVVGANGVVASVDHQGRATDLGGQLAHAGLVGEPRRELGRHQRLGVGLERPADRVLALLGGVRLGENLGEEELEEVLVVLEPVVAVPLLPAAVGLVPVGELLLGRSARHSRGQRQGRRDEHHRRRRVRGGHAASSRDRSAPRESETSTARSVPVASMHASASSAYSCST